ncbi:MAG: hypothetical protein WKG07_06630 [Hymenobacter sp.]
MKLLVLLSRFPYPLDKGDKLRAYHHCATWPSTTKSACLPSPMKT